MIRPLELHTKPTQPITSDSSLIEETVTRLSGWKTSQISMINLSRTERVSKAVSLAETAYKNRRYQQSRSLLTNALALALQTGSREEMGVLDILDSRVRVHVKMKNMAAAESDAKRMIQHDKTDPRGYLRCAQVARSAGDYEIAVIWCEQGLKRVPFTHRHYQQLKSLLNKVETLARDATQCSKPIDPIRVLPPEIIEIILSYLTFRQVVQALRVSKGWSRLLQALRPLVDTIDCGTASKELSRESLVICLRRLGDVPKTMIFNNLSKSASYLLNRNLEHSQRFSSLETLNISACPLDLGAVPFARFRLKDLKLNVRIRPCEVWAILKTCRRIETAAFKMVDQEPLTEDAAADPVQCPELKELCIAAPVHTHFTPKATFPVCGPLPLHFHWRQ